MRELLSAMRASVQHLVSQGIAPKTAVMPRDELRIDIATGAAGTHRSANKTRQHSPVLFCGPCSCRYAYRPHELKLWLFLSYPSTGRYEAAAGIAAVAHRPY